MAVDIRLLRDSFALVVEREPELTRRFYEILFERYPRARALFGRTAARAQEQMLRDALVAVIDHLDDAHWLEHTLGALGRRHEGYGVTTVMYEWVGECLLATLAEVSAEAWTERHVTAWSAAYGAIAAAMQAGTVRATG